MKNVLLSFVLLLIMSTPALALETPAWRDSASATGRNPTVNLSVQPGDVVIVYVTSNNHALSDLNSGSANDGEDYWSYGQAVWKQANGKYSKTQVFIKPHQAASAGTLSIAIDSSSAATCVIAVAISGLTVVNLTPDVTGTGTHTVRQQKSNGQDVNSSDAPIMPGTVPTVPKFGQTQTYLSTSLVLAAFANESNPNGVSAPSGYTQQATVATTAGGKSLSLSIVSATGITDYTTTWGSTTASRGNASTLEIQPLQ